MSHFPAAKIGVEGLLPRTSAARVADTLIEVWLGNRTERGQGVMRRKKQRERLAAQEPSHGGISDQQSPRGLLAHTVSGTHGAA